MGMGGMNNFSGMGSGNYQAQMQNILGLNNNSNNNGMKGKVSDDGFDDF